MTDDALPDDWHSRNRAALASCPRPHRFSLLWPGGDDGDPARYRCKDCGGEIGERAHGWYCRGFADGAGLTRKKQEKLAAKALAAAAA